MIGQMVVGLLAIATLFAPSFPHRMNMSTKSVSDLYASQRTGLLLCLEGTVQTAMCIPTPSRRPAYLDSKRSRRS